MSLFEKNEPKVEGRKEKKREKGRNRGVREKRVRVRPCQHMGGRYRSRSRAGGGGTKREGGMKTERRREEKGTRLKGGKEFLKLEGRY